MILDLRPKLLDRRVHNAVLLREKFWQKQLREALERRPHDSRVQVVCDALAAFRRTELAALLADPEGREHLRKLDPDDEAA